MKRYVHIYTGEGKGKTTAAIGLVIRAVGAGLRVFVGQFIKGSDSSEIALLRQRCPEVTVEQFGRGRFIRGKATTEDIDAARLGLQSSEQRVGLLLDDFPQALGFGRRIDWRSSGQNCLGCLPGGLIDLGCCVEGVQGAAESETDATRVDAVGEFLSRPTDRVE